MENSGVKIIDFELIPIWNRNQKTVARFSVVIFDVVTIYGFILRYRPESGFSITYPRRFSTDTSNMPDKVLSVRRELFDLMVNIAEKEYAARSKDVGGGFDRWIDVLTAPIDGSEDDTDYEANPPF